MSRHQRTEINKLHLENNVQQTAGKEKNKRETQTEKEPLSDAF